MQHHYYHRDVFLNKPAPSRMDHSGLLHQTAGMAAHSRGPATDGQFSSVQLKEQLLGVTSTIREMTTAKLGQF